MRAVGIDLAGLEKNPSGFCILEFNEKTKTNVELLFTTKEILEKTVELRPNVVAIDAPLSFPKKGYFRDSDIELRRRGFRPLSPLFPSMKLLTNRGILIKSQLNKRGIKVIEVFPRATESILGLKKEPRINEHMYDALLCALTGKFYLQNKYELVGGEIVIPKT